MKTVGYHDVLIITLSNSDIHVRGSQSRHSIPDCYIILAGQCSRLSN